MAPRLVCLAIGLTFALNAVAAVEVGPPRVDVAAAGQCARDNARCLSVVGQAPQQLLLWPEESSDGKVRLRGALGARRIELFEARFVDHASAATDGESFLVIWQHPSGSDLAISSVFVSASGATTARSMLDRWARPADPPAAAVWTGLEFAVVLPTSIVFGGSRVADLGRVAGNSLSGAAASVSGSSILAVRLSVTPVYSGGFGMGAWTSGGDTVATSNLVGSSVGDSQSVLAPSKETHALSVAAGGDGYLLAWKDARTLHTVRLDQSGRPVTREQEIGWIRRTGGVTAVAKTRDGWLLVWDDRAPDGVRSVKGAELDANGAPLGEVMTIATGGRSPSLASLGGDRFRVFYRTATDIESRLVTTGAPPPRRRAVR